MAEKRKSRRIVAPEALPVKDSETRVTLGFLCDLSIGGMMIIGDGPFVVNKPRRIKIILPQRIMGTRHLELEAICRWKAKTPARGGFNAGYEFAALTQEQELLIALVEAEYVVRGLPLEHTSRG
jgi:hypothetical protein